MITISALALFVAVQQPPVQTPAWIGKWEGHYTEERDERQYIVALEISDKYVSGKGYEVKGSYDHRQAKGNDWAQGDIHGHIDKDGQFKWLYRFPGQPKSWGQHEGKLVFDEEKKTFICETATISTPSPDEEQRNPKSSQVFLNRPSG